MLEKMSKELEKLTTPEGKDLDIKELRDRLEKTAKKAQKIADLEQVVK